VNTTLEPGRRPGPAQDAGRRNAPGMRIPSTRRPRRPATILDRLALRLGLALIAWGRRERLDPAAERERLAIQLSTRAARIERERQAELAMWLTLPRR